MEERKRGGKPRHRFHAIARLGLLSSDVMNLNVAIVLQIVIMWILLELSPCLLGIHADQ